MKLQLFDPHAEVSIKHRKLPHWEQPGALYFITFRTIDSLPQSVIAHWQAERDAWLFARGIEPHDAAWREGLAKLSAQEQRVFHNTFLDKWFDLLDECHGECLLRQREFADLVAASLRYFDNDRYVLSDFVVMPNHVHVLVQFPSEGQSKTQCRSWKHFTATEIHRQLGRKGHFWQGESFDHLVRSEEQYRFLREYIASNPQKANLAPGEFVHYRKA